MVRPHPVAHQCSARQSRLHYSGRVTFRPMLRLTQPSAHSLILVILRASVGIEIIDEKGQPACVADFPGFDPGAAAILG